MKFQKIDLHPYQVIKHKKGYEALMRYQEQCRAINIPEYRIVRRVNGEDQITIANAKSNKDIFKLWRRELDFEKAKILMPDTTRYVVSREDSPRPNRDAAREDQLLIG